MAKHNYWSFKEQVATELQQLGIPKQKAELAIVDMRRSVINTSFKERRLPQDTARIILDEVKRIYRC